MFYNQEVSYVAVLFIEHVGLKMQMDCPLMLEWGHWKKRKGYDVLFRSLISQFEVYLQGCV